MILRIKNEIIFRMYKEKYVNWEFEKVILGTALRSWIPILICKNVEKKRFLRFLALKWPFLQGQLLEAKMPILPYAELKSCQIVLQKREKTPIW